MNDLIGVFDSGMGGISVLHTVRALMPREHYLFYGDNAHAPYGTKSLEEIRALTRDGIDVLLSRGVKAILIACNTATSAYAATLREQVDIPVVGMEPAIKPAQESRHGGVVPTLATRATLTLPKFKRLMRTYGEGIVPVVGEGLVELVEAGKHDTPEAEAAVRKLLAPFEGQQVDSIVLGCTHYPYLIPVLRRIYPDIPIYDGREGTARQLRRLLRRANALTNDTEGSIEFLSSGGSGDTEQMRRMLAALD